MDLLIAVGLQNRQSFLHLPVHYLVEVYALNSELLGLSSLGINVRTRNEVVVVQVIFKLLLTRIARDSLAGSSVTAMQVMAYLEIFANNESLYPKAYLFALGFVQRSTQIVK